MVAIKVPSVGESISEGTIAHWLKKDGDAVRADEPLFELETEKATNTIPAPAGGTLKIAVAEGQTVPIGTVVGHIDPSASTKQARNQRDRKDGKEAAVAAPAKPPEKAGKPAPAEAPLSPAVRRLIEEA